MILSRRHLLASGALFPALARAQAAGDPRLSPRTAGNPSAPAHVQEWFSLTCTHCARFDLEVFPEVKSKLIDTGKVYYIFQDFPLDRIALMAAMVARALPPDRYMPFVNALLASQDRWAFAAGVDTKAVLQQMAGLAGMSEATFNATVNDADYQKAIIAEQDAGQKRYHIDSTPTFIFGNTAMPGELTYAMFADRIGHLAG